MGIAKEDFLKLKQGDRIEYLIRLKRIEEENESKETLSLGNVLVYWAIPVMILISIFLYQIGGAGLVSKFLTNFSNPLLLLALFLLTILCFLTDLYFTLRINKEKKELESEFFKVEVKTRR